VGPKIKIENETKVKHETTETKRFECKNCSKVWTYAGGICKVLGRCSSCINPEEELQKFMPWITKMFVKYQIPGGIRSQIIRDMMREYFEKKNRLKRIIKRGGV
jgi:hypothetical protein